MVRYYYCLAKRIDLEANRSIDDLKGIIPV